MNEPEPPNRCEKCSRIACRCPKNPETFAHSGRRRKRITEDLFRCALHLVVRDVLTHRKILCNALVWRTPDKMREHLKEHLSEAEIDSLSDDQVRERYVDAQKIKQEGIPDDEELED
jgi:hypothetical protein